MKYADDKYGSGLGDSSQFFWKHVLFSGTNRMVEQHAYGDHRVQDLCLLLMWLSWQAPAESRLLCSVPTLSSASLCDFEKLMSEMISSSVVMIKGFGKPGRFVDDLPSLSSHHWALNPETSVTTVFSFGLKLAANRNCLLSFHAGKSSGRICHTHEVFGLKRTLPTWLSVVAKAAKAWRMRAEVSVVVLLLTTVNDNLLVWWFFHTYLFLILKVPESSWNCHFFIAMTQFILAEELARIPWNKISWVGVVFASFVFAFHWL